MRVADICEACRGSCAKKFTALSRITTQNFFRVSHNLCAYAGRPKQFWGRWGYAVWDGVVGDRRNAIKCITYGGMFTTRQDGGAFPEVSVTYMRTND